MQRSAPASRMQLWASSFNLSILLPLTQTRQWCIYLVHREKKLTVHRWIVLRALMNNNEVPQWNALLHPDVHHNMLEDSGTWACKLMENGYTGTDVVGEAANEEGRIVEVVVGGKERTSSEIN